MIMLSDYGYKVCATCGYMASDRMHPLWEGEECESCSDTDRRCYRCGSKALWQMTCGDCGATDA